MLRILSISCHIGNLSFPGFDFQNSIFFSHSFPESVYSIKHIQDHYHTIGFPSCIGSIDEFLSFGIAVLLDYSLHARERRRHQYLPFKSLFQLQKNKKVLYVSNVRFGCYHDKTIARFYATITNFRSKSGKHLEQQCLVVLQTR